jgi:hypothetical protein
VFEGVTVFGVVAAVPLLVEGVVVVVLRVEYVLLVVDRLEVVLRDEVLDLVDVLDEDETVEEPLVVPVRVPTPVLRTMPSLISLTVWDGV